LVIGHSRTTLDPHVHITATLTPADYLAAQRLHFRPKPAFRWVLYVIAALFAGMLIQEALIIAQHRQLPRFWWVLPAGLAYGAFLFFVLLPWRVNNIFKKQPALAETTRTNLDGDGLHLQTSRGQIRFKWSMLKRWKRNRDYILVYHSALHFHIFPRRAFASPEDFSEAAALLEKHLGPEQP
jgi:hypothetical protein